MTRSRAGNRGSRARRSAVRMNTGDAPGNSLHVIVMIANLIAVLDLTVVRDRNATVAPELDVSLDRPVLFGSLTKSGGW